MLTSVLIHIDDGILHVSNKDPENAYAYVVFSY